jgi:hypothetical protein
MIGVVKNAVMERLAGKRPSPIQAIVASAAAGAIAAAVTYKALRG